MNIFVAKLDYSIQEEDLRDVFSEYGEVKSVKIIMDKFTRRSKGFGFVEMDDEEAGQKAIEELNGAELEGKTMVVKVANPREERPRGGDRGGRSDFNSRGGGRY